MKYIRILGIVTLMLIGIPAVGMLGEDLFYGRQLPDRPWIVLFVLDLSLVLIMVSAWIGVFRQRWQFCLATAIGLTVWLAVVATSFPLSLPMGLWMLAPLGYMAAAQYMKRNRRHTA